MESLNSYLYDGNSRTTQLIASYTMRGDITGPKLKNNLESTGTYDLGKNEDWVYTNGISTSI